MAREVAEADALFLSAFPPSAANRRLAFAVLLASLVVFLIAAPFAKTPLAEVPAFLPMYQSALVLSDLMTAVLLYGQYDILRSRGLLALASGYLFSALMAVVHLLSFPGLFAAHGLLGSGSQTTAWLYFLWHGVFPLSVIAYVRVHDERRVATRPVGRRAAAAIPVSVAVVVLLVVLLTLLTTVGHDALPAIMSGNRDAPAKVVVAAASWIASVVALGMLWRRKGRSLLDLWLMVVMCVWIFDVALAAVLNGGRFDVGWYMGRIYGLAAASFVLGVLLLENGILYTRLAEAFERERRERRLGQEKTEELTELNRDLDAFSYSVSHDLRAPLRALDGFAAALEEDHGSRLDADALRLLGRVRANAKRMGQLIEDLLAFARLGRRAPATQRVGLAELVDKTIAELRPPPGTREVEFVVGELGVVIGDPGLLRQALFNLLSNAMKFTRDRRPAVIEVGVREEAGAAVFHVKDNGVGFDMSNAGKLFGVFQRLHRADEFEGTGVGLAIVHKVITRHGGRIWAESVPGEGATFHFTLPRAD